MGRRRTRRVSLANRLVLLAGLIVIVTTLLVSLGASLGIYELAERYEVVRKTSLRDLLVTEVGGRLTSAHRLLRTTADTAALTGEDESAARGVLAKSAIENAQYFEGMALLDEQAGVVAAWPHDIGSVAPLAVDSARRAAGPPPAFVWLEPERQLWVIVPVRAPDGSVETLAARARTDFIDAALADVVSAGDVLTAAVMTAEGSVVFSGGDDSALRSGSVTYIQTGDDAGGSAVAAGSPPLTGHYADLSMLRGLNWTVAVFAPSELAVRETVAALRPGVLGPVAALVVALAASLVVVRRVSRPLRHLERRARALATGADVEPGPVEADDQIGRLLDAFDSIGFRLTRLSEMTDLLAHSSDTELVLDGIATSIAHMLGDVGVEVVLRDDDGSLRRVAASGVTADDELIAPGSEPWLEHALAAETQVSALDERAEAVVLVTPLSSGDEVIGAIGVTRAGAVGFTDGEADTVRTFAAQASVALHNSRLFDEERRSRREAQALLAIAERVAAPDPVVARVDDVGRMAADLLGFDLALFAVDEPGSYGLPAVYRRCMLDAWRDRMAASGDAGATSSPMVVRVADDAECPEVVTAVRGGTKSALMIPLRRDDAVIGLLALLSGRVIDHLDGVRARLAAAIGAQVALLFENAYLLEETRRRADNLETIFRISHAVSSSLQSRVVLNRVLDVVQKILSADAVMLMTYDARRKVLTVPMARGILHRDMFEAEFAPGEDVPGRVFETREPERYDLLGVADTRLINAASAQGLRSMLIVPLLARGRSIGVLAVFSTAERAFTTEDLDLLRTFGSQAALAIDTAEMYSREHHVATVLQESILPTRLPRAPGVSAGAVYVPAGGEAEIGGDYYDVFEAPDGRIVVSIGDVCGKGVVAATKTSMIKYTIRGLVAAGLSPGSVLAELNLMLARSGDPAGIVTLWIGLVDVVRGAVTFANAGHPPALLADPSCSGIERLTTTGPLLGAVEDALWTEREVPIETGGTLLLYTDGVTEARSAGRFFGEGRIRRVLRGGGTATGIAEGLLGAITRFTAGELRDDAAILVVRFEDAGSAAGAVSAERAGG